MSTPKAAATVRLSGLIASELRVVSVHQEVERKETPFTVTEEDPPVTRHQECRTDARRPLKALEDKRGEVLDLRLQGLQRYIGVGREPSGEGHSKAMDLTVRKRDPHPVRNNPSTWVGMSSQGMCLATSSNGAPLVQHTATQQRSV